MEFPIHQRPNVSKLEPLREEVQAMRTSRWPFRKISQWIRENRQLDISREAIRQFCLVREIKEVRHNRDRDPSAKISRTPSKGPAKKIFHFDDSAPIATSRNLPPGQK